MIVTNSLSGGGAERSMNLVANELVSRDWLVSLVPINLSAPDEIVPNCEMFPLERKWRGNFSSTVNAILKFNVLVRKWNPDIVFLNCDLPEFFGALLFNRRKLIVLEHSSNSWTNRKNLGRIVRYVLRFRKATWVAVSSHLTIWPFGVKPSFILQNPLAPSGEQPPHKVGSEIKRLIYIGRLSPEKRPEIVLEISKRTNIELILIGDGILRNQLEDIAKKNTIRAIFLGRIGKPWNEIKAGDLLVVPSSFEGDGLVIIEGMQKGIPMLLADIPDFRRFNLPERNYCQDVEAFEAQCMLFRVDLNGLTVPHEISEDNISARTLESVAYSWEKFLNQN
jgi:glycosyltransferase involved in cell wall biosynthesis